MVYENATTGRPLEGKPGGLLANLRRRKVQREDGPRFDKIGPV